MIVRLATHAMGTRFEIVLDGDDPNRLRCVGEAALEAVTEWERRISLFAAGSFLSYINANAGARPVRLDDEMFELLAACADVHAASGGAFDVTVAPLMEAWGFRGESGEVQAARTSVGMNGVELDDRNHSIRFTRPGMKLDLGAVGKGQGLDDAASILRENGIERALLHGGTSTAVAIGAPPGEDGWRIALRCHGCGTLRDTALPSAHASSDDRHDCAQGGTVVAPEMPIVTLRDAALAVSAPTGRMIEVDGENLGHVLDPRTGRPTAGANLAAVIAPAARTADAWSTALLVLGEHSPRLPRECTTLIEHEAAGEPRRSVFGAHPELFSIPDGRESATEEAA